MKKIIKIATCIVFILQYSCIKETPYSFESEDIINNSTHKITLGVFLRVPPSDTTYVIYEDEHVNFSFYSRIVGLPPPFSSDSVRVTYDDSISIMHYRSAVQTASRSILRASSWSGGKVEEYRYEWEYIFTDADYLEALEYL